MATSAILAVERDDGHVDMVYVHGDGYLAHTGQLLINNYTYADIKELIHHCHDNRNYISSLGPSMYDTHYGYSSANSNEIMTFENVDEFTRERTGNHSYMYLMTKEKEWYCMRNIEWKPLTEETIKYDLN